ncbi:hypothetical protein CDL12_06685 [Handroanthus impetiginosus]|uniref:Uncharacterized protein n=1 Tax=Handroanthus impetiginosus TaxID=429701 RepID=A0A2G9HT39_9LAMI|nr:hypothetical protein CDL12_06685 [Handroanthus impetiginosus]
MSCQKPKRCQKKRRREREMLIQQRKELACNVVRKNLQEERLGIDNSRKRMRRMLIKQTEEACLISSFQIHQSDKREEC